ncbi:MAG: NAD(P)H:quinone oxidoreductase [Actinomycetota bacterium]|nr:NAD(P)H:quinone oxidoreductase [Actinomycetota bacterium]
MTVNVSVVYYSATGNVHRLATAAARAAEDAGAKVRLHRAPELAPDEAIAANPDWARHREETADVPEASVDDLDWGDVLLFGSPTRFGNIAAQLKQVMDTAGPLWQQGALADKVVSGFTSAMNPHGGQESTLLALYNTMYHWGSIIVPAGYTDETVYAAGGNPYGTSVTHGADEDAFAAAETAMAHVTRRAITVAERLRATS